MKLSEESLQRFDEFAQNLIAVQGTAGLESANEP